MSQGKMSLQQLVSQITANRKQFFDLIDALEKESACNLSEELLEAEIDSDYSGREEVTAEEAQNIIMACSVKYPVPRGGLRAVR